jgi:hypothetical protein
METIEIKDFKLTIEFSQYWISYEENGDGLRYPVILSPYNLIKLFEIEGIELTLETDGVMEQEGICFTKSILIRNKVSFGGDLLGEEFDDLTAQPCWVKLK